MRREAVDEPAANLVRSLMRLAESAARVGGQVALRALGRSLRVRLKSDDSEVTAIDERAQRAIVAHIRKSRPHDLFVGEESGLNESARGRPPSEGAKGVRSAAAPVVWVIDPIDGTRNYIRGSQHFACSVGALAGGVPIAGAIYEPVADVLVSAGRGQGAWRDGRRLRLGRALHTGSRHGSLLVGIPSAWRAGSAAFVESVVRDSIIRSFGSAALHLVQVATGAMDAVLMNNCKLWDIAGGAIIVTEAGGVISYPDGRPMFPASDAVLAGAETPTLAGAPAAHKLLARRWRALRARQR